MKVHPTISILFILLLFITVRAVEPTPSHIGHWRSSPAGTEELFLKPNGQFLQVLKSTPDGTPVGIAPGTYKLDDGVLKLYYGPNAPLPVRYSYVLQDNDTLILTDMRQGEKTHYKRVPESK